MRDFIFKDESKNNQEKIEDYLKNIRKEKEEETLAPKNEQIYSMYDRFMNNNSGSMGSLYNECINAFRTYISEISL